MSIGKKLSTLRRARNLSQKQLAEKLFVQHTTISNWEKDVRKISIEQLKEIADFFEVELTYFTDENEHKNPATSKPSQKQWAMAVALLALAISTTGFVMYNQSNRLTIDSCYGEENCVYINDPSIVNELTERNITGGVMTNVELNMVYDFLKNYHWLNHETIATNEQKQLFEAYLQVFNESYITYSEQLHQAMMQYFLDPEMKKVHTYLDFESINQNDKQYIIQDGIKYILFKTGQENFSYEVYDSIKRYTFTIDLTINALYLDSQRILPNIESTISSILNTEATIEYEGQHHWFSHAFYVTETHRFLATAGREKNNGNPYSFHLTSLHRSTYALSRIEVYIGTTEINIMLVANNQWVFYPYDLPLTIPVIGLLDFIASMDDGVLQPRVPHEGDGNLEELIPLILDAFGTFPYEVWDGIIEALKAKSL